jgi:O-antigen ligase
LPAIGLSLLTLALLPQVNLLGLWPRMFAVALGSAAIVLGGNRATLAMAIVTLLAIAVARRKVKLVVFALCGIAAGLAALYVMGENMKFARGVGFLRVAALVSPRAAQQSEAWQTEVWRKLRWERAMADIRKHPWMGLGYGGLGGIFAYASSEGYEQNLIEIDVAAGSIHNGFLSSARAFGIPFCFLFIGILVHRTWSHGGQAMRDYRIDPLQGDLHSFVFASLASMPLAILIGADLNNALIWFYISLGLILFRLGSKPKTVKALPVSRPFQATSRSARVPSS